MAPVESGVRILLGLLPVFSFLIALILLDGYKLVRPRRVVALIAAGACAAAAGLIINGAILEHTAVGADPLVRLIAPAVEELLKGSIIVVLLVRRRIGFLVDAAIFGFAVGAGFALVENPSYFFVLDDRSLALWVVRGFGTAVMHGGVSAIFAMVSKTLADWHGSGRAWVYLPGLVVAWTLHSLFNHFFFSPYLSTALILAVLPVFFLTVFHLSERGTRDWLGVGFDTDAELLEIIGQGRVTESRLGGYLDELRERFPRAVVADMLCLLRLRAELSIRAKGVLLARQAGFTLPPDPEMDERLAEIEYLEHAIGPTGLLSLHPVRHMSDREIWQIHALAR
ncbi:MAG: PrsW family glutamic-type intramembrane protease [Holophagae bacterium]|jgi:RsiW-degrading membrane proteinase PrsW (M82 family)